MIHKKLLIDKINIAFRGVKLEDGIGLWEAQGHDDRLSLEECKKLRSKDEKENWNKIPLIDLYKCSSSLSFFDAKGMRFHMPKFLLFYLDVFEKEEDELFEQGLTKNCSAPDILFSITAVLKYLNDNSDMGKRMRKYNKERFSLINTEQIECLILFIEYRKKEIVDYYDNPNTKGKSPSGVKFDEGYIEMEKGIEFWKVRKTSANTI